MRRLKTKPPEEARKAHEAEEARKVHEAEEARRKKVEEDRVRLAKVALEKPHREGLAEDKVESERTPKAPKVTRLHQPTSSKKPPNAVTLSTLSAEIWMENTLTRAQILTILCRIPPQIGPDLERETNQQLLQRLQTFIPVWRNCSLDWNMDSMLNQIPTRHPKNGLDQRKLNVEYFLHHLTTEWQRDVINPRRDFANVYRVPTRVLPQMLI